jgi:hypothetical protein
MTIAVLIVVLALTAALKAIAILSGVVVAAWAAFQLMRSFR